MKKSSLLIFIALSWLAYACSTSSGKNTNFENPDLIPVSVLNLEPVPVKQLVYTSGQFTTHDETSLAFKIGGIIQKIAVKEGDAVRKGQLLAALDLTEINAQVAQAQLGFEKAKRDFERASRLYQDSVATLEQYQNAKTGLDIAAHQLETAKFNRSYSEIRAIDNGFVLRKMANEGQVITSGTPVLQTNSGKQGNWVLRVAVSDQEWSQLSVGDKAAITISAVSDETFEAFIQRKSEGADAFTGTFNIELKLKGKLPPTLASGLFGKAVITPSKKNTAWAIPYDALLDGDAQSGYVFITNDMRTVKKQSVTISSIEKERVVISGGLEGAKAVVIAGSAYLKDNSSIRITSTARDGK